MWSILETVPYTFENNVYYNDSGQMFYTYIYEVCVTLCVIKGQYFPINFLSGWSIKVNGVLMSPYCYYSQFLPLCLLVFALCN